MYTPSHNCTKEFVREMAKAVAAMRGNDQYLTRFGDAREIVTKMDMKEIRIFLKHYKEHK